jgi:hypothetical protein
MVARAIESVLDQVPGSIDTSVPEAGATKLQPWAETAAPVGRNKRPLEDLLVELEARVTADPDAKATLPRTRHPALAFFDRFGRPGEPRTDRGAEGGQAPGRRRRRRRGAGGPAQAVQNANPAEGVAGGPSSGRPAGGKRRRRGRGGRSGDSAATGQRPSGAAPAGNPGNDAQPRPPGTGRRRRGRRGRGGERPPVA